MSKHTRKGPIPTSPGTSATQIPRPWIIETIGPDPTSRDDGPDPTSRDGGVPVASPFRVSASKMLSSFSPGPLCNSGPISTRPLFSSRTDLFMPPWFMEVLSGANFVYVCPSRHLWFAHGFESVLYCVKSSVLWGYQSGERYIPSLEDICVSDGAQDDSPTEIKGVAGIAADGDGNIFILEFRKSVCVRRYRTGHWAGQRLVLQPRAHAVDPKTGDMTTALMLPECTLSLRRRNHLEALTVDGRKYRIVMRGYRRFPVIELEYDESTTKIGKAIYPRIKERQKDEFSYTAVYESKKQGVSEQMIYVYMPNSGALYLFDKEWNLLSSTLQASPVETTVAVEVDQNTGNLIVYGALDELPLFHVIEFDTGRQRSVVCDKLVAALSYERPALRVIGFSRGPDSLLIYCGDRIISLTP